MYIIIRKNDKLTESVDRFQTPLRLIRLAGIGLAKNVSWMMPLEISI